MNYPNYMDPMMTQGYGMPEFKGTWINKNTGETVLVRDVVLMDEGMTIVTSSGTMIDMNTFSSDYYQMSDEEYDMSGNKINDRPIPPVKPMPRPKPKPTPKPMPKPMPPMPDPDDEPKDEPAFIKEKKHMDLIVKLFDVKKPTATCKVSFEVENFPKDELQMLIDVYGIHINDIAAYLYKKWYTSEEVITMIKEYLTDTQGLKEGDDSSDDSTTEP